MLTRIREILAEEYIGAIIIGMMAVQGILSTINISTEPLYVYLSNRRAKALDTEQVRGLSDLMGYREFDWWSWGVRLLVVFVYFLVAYGLMVWIYMRSPAVPKEEMVEESQ